MISENDIRINTNYAYRDLQAAINTLNASRWELLKARILGTKIVSADGYIKITVYHYKGKRYLIDYRNH